MLENSQRARGAVEIPEYTFDIRSTSTKKLESDKNSG